MKSLVFFILYCDVTCDCTLTSMYPFGNILQQKVKVLGIPDVNATIVFGDR